MYESKKNFDGWVKINLIYVDFRIVNMFIELEWIEFIICIVVLIEYLGIEFCMVILEGG